MMFKLNSLVPGVNLKVTHTFFILCLYTYFDTKGLSSQSMMIPNKVSAGLEVIAVTSIDATKISNKWHFPGLTFIWLLSNQWKSFAEVI